MLLWAARLVGLTLFRLEVRQKGHSARARSVCVRACVQPACSGVPTVVGTLGTPAIQPWQQRDLVYTASQQLPPSIDRSVSQH